MRTLAIDFGERRVGVAMSGPDGSYAIPLAALERRTDRVLVASLAALATEHRVRRFVVGEPRNLDGSPHAAAARVRRFAEKLRERSGLQVILVEETLTTVAARERLLEAGIAPGDRSGVVDSTAAQILLEDLLGNERTSSPCGDSVAARTSSC